MSRKHPTRFSFIIRFPLNCSSWPKNKLRTVLATTIHSLTYDLMLVSCWWAWFYILILILTLWITLWSSMLWFHWWIHLEIDDRHIFLSRSSEHDTCRTECTWMGVISPSSLTHSPSLSFCCCHWLSVFCCGDDRCCHQRSQMKGGLYPHLCPSLPTPLSLSPPLALISHLSLRLNNEQSHLFSETRVFRTCYQLDSRNHMATSNTRDDNTRCKCFIPVQALSRVFPSPTLDSGLGVWDSCVSVWFCQPCRNQSITNLSTRGANTKAVQRQLWSCEMN